jgi:hypothetical protein
MLGLPLSFAAPLVLGALVALPAIWLLLRVTPPTPQRIAFPPLKIFADLLPRRETPARTPWWLLAIRLLLAALLILAAAGPVWNPAPSSVADARAPLLLVLDNGFTAARDWRERIGLAVERAEAAGRDGRSIALVPTADTVAEARLLPPSAAIEALRAVRPQPHLPERSRVLPAIERFLATHPETETVWVTDGVAGADGAAFVAGLTRALGGRAPTVFKSDRAPALALAGAEAGGGLAVRVLRAETNGRDAGTVRAVDLKGLPLAEASFAFPASATETEARFDLPIEVRNAIARIEISGEGSAGAVSLLDDRGRRKRVGIASGASIEQAQPLLSPTYYLTRALSPYAELREARGGASEAIGTLLDEQVSVLVLADMGALDRATTDRIAKFVEEGGVLIRFAGSRLAAGNDELVPVRLRRGGRNLGGTLAWDAPRTLAPFTRESPFFGLSVPGDLGVRRQILAEPEGDLASKTWASLQDGTPIVTAARRGEGLIVLYHVTADAAWSNLPLSGLFVDMLRRTASFAGAPGGRPAEREADANQTVAPQRTLDGFGAFVSPPPGAKPVTRSYAQRATAEHPPGFYGPIDASLAVNSLIPGDRLNPLDLTPLQARIAPLTRAETVDLRGPLFLAALLLFLADTLATLWLGGHLGAALGRARRAAAASVVALAALAAAGAGEGALAQPSRAETPRAPLTREAIDAALVTRLAYVVTGDEGVDNVSKAGLTGLTQFLQAKTALEPGEPVGVDLSRDELAFYPLLYWPVVPGRPLPSAAALSRLDAFMKNGGTVIFDTRDALTAGRGASTPEAQHLRRTLLTLDVPELEPVPRDHVLTKAFYILETFPGRHATGQTWVEALPPVPEGEQRPARAGDGVSPIIITGNDLASAWAVDRRGLPLYPVSGDPRQREMAFRGGVNIVMYVLTGNYKADQVHVPALLERLGQ